MPRGIGEPLACAQVTEALWRLLRSFGFFLLVMGAIFLVLLLTRWIGKKWGKH